MSKHLKIDIERCKELFEYRDGKLIRKVRTANRVNVGDVAGSLHKSSGYYLVSIDGKRFNVSRIVYAMHFGDPGDKQIDHVNQIKTDDRIENLRLVTQKENLRNQPNRKNNSSGITGVFWCKKSQKWRVMICVDGKLIHCGFFNHLGAAAVERKYQEFKYGYHENHGSEKQ